MGQKKGHTGNLNGRPKGTPNKTTSEVRQWLSRLISDNMEQMEKDLQALEPKDRLMMLERFMQYTTPKMQSMEAKVDLAHLTDAQLDTVINELANQIAQ